MILRHISTPWKLLEAPEAPQNQLGILVFQTILGYGDKLHIGSQF